ncbi:MAG: adenylate kinase [Anaerolineaceae bacterium]|nr:adenylate kinase [Anaerolineaceae bacterium]
MATYIVLLGPPGAGKGTQAQVISREMKLAHISSGDLFRENLKNQTELGKLAQGYMNRGELVPDDVTIAMVRDRLSRPDCKEGALLDGFPRTPAQAEALSEMLATLGQDVHRVPYISVPAELLIERLGGRWTCPSCGHVYHEKYNPPKQPGVCDVEGTQLIQRDDDQAETVERRIRVYMDQTSPLIKYYRQKGLLVEVDGTRGIEDVSKDILVAIK